MQDIIINLLLDLFYNADYHTQVFLCFAVFLTGLLVCLGFFLMAHYSNGGFGRLLWRLVGLAVLGCFSYVSAQGAYVGFQNFRIAKEERIKDAKIRREVDRQKYELMKSMQVEEHRKQMEQEAREEAEKQLRSGGVISAFDFVNGTGGFQRNNASAQSDVIKPEEPEMVDDDTFLTGGKDNGAKQNMSRSLKDIERALRDQLREVNKQIAESDTAYKTGNSTTYQQLLSKAKLEQRKQGLIIEAMKEKLAVIDESGLAAEDKSAVYEATKKRLDTAVTEQGQYAEVEQLLIERKDEYESL